MKDKGALFLLQAIGEISESTLEDAELPDRRHEIRSLRRPVLIAASILLVIALTVGAVMSVNDDQGSKSPSAAESAGSADHVSMDDAVSAAMILVKDTGALSILSHASYIADSAHPYYLVKLVSDDGTYDCSVDAQTGRVTEISHEFTPTEPPTAETAPTESGTDTNAPADDSSPADENDVMPDTSEITDSADMPISSHSVPAVTAPAQPPTEYPTLSEDKEKKPATAVSNDAFENQRPTGPYAGLSHASGLSGLSGQTGGSQTPHAGDPVIDWGPNN